MIEGEFDRTLKCDLSPAEVEARAQALAMVQKDIDDNVEEAKSCADSFKTARKRMEAKRKGLAEEVRDKATYRSVLCVQRLNADDETVETVRTDTGQVYETRPATDADKQQNFFEPPVEDEGE